jgi:hypothetical protein
MELLDLLDRLCFLAFGGSIGLDRDAMRVADDGYDHILRLMSYYLCEEDAVSSALYELRDVLPSMLAPSDPTMDYEDIQPRLDRVHAAVGVALRNPDTYQHTDGLGPSLEPSIRLSRERVAFVTESRTLADAWFGTIVERVRAEGSARPSSAIEFEHNESFRWIRHLGIDYNLTPLEASVVQYLASLSGTPATIESIAEVVAEATKEPRMTKWFRKNPGLIGTLIIKVGSNSWWLRL